MNQPETNIELITRIMDYSPTGALTQIVVMTALERYCESVCILGDTEPDNWPSLISWPAWKESCEYILNELENRK